MKTLADASGVWFVPNPDRGETLPDDSARLLIGGRYTVAFDGGAVAEVELRDRHNRVFLERRIGQASVSAGGRLRISFADGHTEVFQWLDDRALRRETTTRDTGERQCVLTLVQKLAGPEPVAASRSSTLPSIFLNTMPKSGSIYLSRWLARGLGIREMKVAVCLFPDDLVIRERLDELARGNAITQQHLPAKDINLRFIAGRMRKLAVHVRDPRQATLSWVHHLDNFYAHRDIVPACRLGLEAVSPELPDDYFAWDFEAKVDYQINHHLPALIEWTDRWMAAAARRAHGLDIICTTFEEFASDQERTLERILVHFGISVDLFDWAARPEKSAETHYRRGSVDEWRAAFTPDQRRRATAVIPGNLSERFGWR